MPQIPQVNNAYTNFAAKRGVSESKRVVSGSERCLGPGRKRAGSGRIGSKRATSFTDLIGTTRGRSLHPRFYALPRRSHRSGVSSDLWTALARWTVFVA
ncbi:hypothetical protein QL285_041565 [Trifolium repens]|nr:hypothetical protein QL285_041565 [Trifolium repens]